MNHRNPKRVRWLLAGGCAALLGLVFMWPRPAPKFNGRTLHEWVVPPSGLGHDDLSVLWQWHSNATVAFQAAGPEAATFLLHEMKASESAWRWRSGRLGDWLVMKNWLKEPRPRWLRPPGTWIRQFNIANILSTLTTQESLSIIGNQFLEVLDSLKQTNTFWLGPPADQIGLTRFEMVFTFTQFFANAGAHGVPVLTNALLTTQHEGVKRAVLDALSNPREHSPAVPAIVATAEDPRLLVSAANALARIRGDSSLSLPVLIRAATNGHHLAIAALGDYGTNVRPWLPQLSSLTNHPDPTVRFQWELAQPKIAGP